MVRTVRTATSQSLSHSVTHPLVELGVVVLSLGAQVVYHVVVLVLLFQEAVHFIYVVPVHTLQLLGGEAHSY